jgi:hypothetical protein
MRPTGAGAVYPPAAADGIHRREVNFRLEYESEREVSGRQSCGMANMPACLACVDPETGIVDHWVSRSTD